jgi:hypothetical protein
MGAALIAPFRVERVAGIVTKNGSFVAKSGVMDDHFTSDAALAATAGGVW